MQLYFTPLACSLATRITLYECGGEHTFTEVEALSRRLPDGQDFRALNPLGQVPVLRDDALLLSENAAILQYIARNHPDARLAPRDPIGLARLQQWLSFIGTELHKSVFNPLLDPTAPAEVKQYALGKSRPRLDRLALHLQQRSYLLDEFSVADAYLTAVLGWVPVTPIVLDEWPTLVSYLKGIRARPAVQRAIAEERALYLAERERAR